MTDIRTRHLIVTLPDVSGEEADWIAEDLEAKANVSGATVTHALGEAVLAGSLFNQYQGSGIKSLRNTSGGQVGILADYLMTPDEARQLAGALLTLAHDIDGK